MNFFKVCGAGLLTVAAVGCWSQDTGGVAVTPDVVAGLRYVNLVSDTAALTFRVVDVINNAPNSINAAFRTGGNPYGVTTNFLPPYFPVDAGTRHIMVFVYSTIDSIASKILLDTTFTFEANKNYTFLLYGYTQTTQPAPRALTAARSGVTGNVDGGLHRYRVTFVTAAGETQGGALSAAVRTSAGPTAATTDDTLQASLTAIPIGDLAVTARNIYRTVANDTGTAAVYKLVTTIANNTATTFTDNVADAGLGATAPAANTTLIPRAAPRLSALILTDNVPALATPTRQIAVRLVNLVPTTAGAPSPAAPVDAWVVPQAATAPLAGTATFANRGFLDLSTYTAMDTSASTGCKLSVTSSSTNTPILFEANLPVGVRGTAAANPVAGSYVAGSAITAVVVPQSVTASAAPQGGAFATPTVLFLVDQRPPQTAP